MRSVLKGFLEHAQGAEVNYVNAPSLAGQLGIQVMEVKSTEPIDYAELLIVRAATDGKAASVAGTFYGSFNNPRIVRINDMPIEAVPEGVVFVIHNNDRPGIIGWVGSVIGKHGINIANMFLGRDEVGGRALTVLNLDSDPSPGLMEELLANPDVLDVTVANL